MQKRDNCHNSTHYSSSYQLLNLNFFVKLFSNSKRVELWNTVQCAFACFIYQYVKVQKTKGNRALCSLKVIRPFCFPRFFRWFWLYLVPLTETFSQACKIVEFLEKISYYSKHTKNPYSKRSNFENDCSSDHKMYL